MKNFIKNNLKVFVTLVISGIVFTGIGVYAASQYFAKDITFTPTNENFKKENGETINNVEDALNELYNNSSKKINGLGDVVKISNYNSTRSNYSSSLSLDSGIYICNAVYGNSGVNASSNLFNKSGQSLVVSGCDEYDEVNAYGNFQSSSVKINTNDYSAIVLLGKTFTCKVNSNKNISFTYGMTDNNSSTPIAFEASCKKMIYE